jgi:transcriptional regulator of heat shock response
MGALKQKNTHLLEKQKEQLKQMALMKKEKDEAVFITQTLKGQLSQAVAKADQVPALEIERNDLQEQIKSVKKQLDAANKDITISRASVEDFKTKLEEAKKQ